MNKLPLMVVYSVIFEAVGKRYFFANYQMNAQSLEVSGCYSATSPYLCGAVPCHWADTWQPSFSGWGEHGWLQPSCTGEKFRSYQELSWGVFWDIKAILYITGHCQDGEVNNLGISVPGGRSEPELHKIQTASLQKLLRQIFNWSIIIMTTK